MDNNGYIKLTDEPVRLLTPSSPEWLDQRTINEYGELIDELVSYYIDKRNWMFKFYFYTDKYGFDKETRLDYIGFESTIELSRFRNTEGSSINLPKYKKLPDEFTLMSCVLERIRKVHPEFEITYIDITISEKDNTINFRNYSPPSCEFVSLGK